MFNVDYNALLRLKIYYAPCTMAFKAKEQKDTSSLVSE